MFIAHMVVGPIGWKIGTGIADVVYAGLTSDFRFIFAGLFGILYAPIVMTGLYHMTNAIDTQLISAMQNTATTVFLVTEEGETSGIQYLTGMDAQAGSTPVIRF